MAEAPEPLEAGESGGSGHAQPIVLPASESGGSGDVHEAMGDAGFQAVFPAFGDSTEFGDVGGAPGENPTQASAASDQSHASRNPTRGDIGGDDDGGGNDDVIEDIIEVSLTGLRGDIGGAAGGQEAVASEAAPPQAAEAWSRSACGGSGGSGAFEVEAPPETVASWNQSACGGSGGSGAFEAAAGSGGAPDSEHMGESHSAPGTGSMQGPAQSTPRAAPESLIGDVGGDHGPVWAAHITGGGSGGIVDSDDQEETGLGFTCGLWPADPPSPNRLSLIAQSAQPASASGDVGPMPTSNSRPGQDLEVQGGYPAPSRGVAEDFDGADSDPDSPEDSPERRAVQEAASALGFLEAAGAPGDSGACSSPSTRPQPFTFDEDELKDEAAGTAGESGACSSPSRPPAFAFDSEEEAKEEAWTAAAPVAEAGTTGESGGCSSASARPEPVAFDEGAEEVKEEAAGTAGESGACSSPSNRPGPEPFNFNFEDVTDEALAEAPSASELAAGTAGETGACSSPSTRPLAFDEEGDSKEAPAAAEGSVAFSPPEPFASFSFEDEATNIPAPEATGNAASTGSAAPPLAQPEPLAFDEDDEVQEEAKASSPPARQADLSFDDEEEAETVEAPRLAEQCRSSSEEAEEPQSEVPAAALMQSPLSFDEDEEEDREAPSRSVEDGRQSALAFDDEDDDEKAKAASAAETGRQGAFAFDDDEDELEAAPAAAETARHSPLTFEDDSGEEEVPAAATEPARQAPLAFEDEEEASLPAETARQAPLSFGDEDDEEEEEVPEASPQTSRPWASAQSEPVEPEDDDDDQFADFASAGSPPTVSQPSAPGAKDDEEEEDENWAFSAAPTSPEPSAANMEELANSVQQLLSRWNEVAKLATAGLAMSLEDEGAAGEQAPNSDDWIRAAVHMPEEAAQLIQSGVSDAGVSSLPLGLFGAPAGPDASSLGNTVREGFFAALGKHLQLPSSKPEAATSPQTSRPSSPQTLAGVSAVPAQVVGQAAPVQSVGAEEAMADVDFGFFEVSTTPKVPAATAQVSSSLDADVLSQALSSVGLQNTAATSTVTMTPDIALTADVGVPQVKKKKKGMTQKVKSFLSGLPDLKHLYSKSVVE